MQLIKDASKDKLRGGFYTPVPIADFLVAWTLEDATSESLILEPSCGDGVFLERIEVQNVPYRQLVGIELEEEEFVKSRSANANAMVLNEDFHQYCNSTEQRFDYVIGNPPYIRFQYFDAEQQQQAQSIYERAGLKYSKLSNAWVSFVVGSTLLLKEQGRLAFVLPAELLQVSYAKQLRAFLAEQFNTIYIVSFQTLVFPHIQQEVVLLMCERDGSGTHQINHVEVEDAKALEQLDLADLKQGSKTLDLSNNKWTYYFLNQEEITFLNTVGEQFGIKPLGAYARVEVGMTTGANKFFTVSQETVRKYALEPFTNPMVGRSVQVAGSVFTTEEWRANVVDGARAFLLTFPEDGILREQGALSYIEYGEDQDIHKGYKCRIRDHWYVVPSRWVSDALLIRRNNLYTRLILNEANAYTTDTMHRVRVDESYDTNAVVASFYNSLSFAFAEISGRSHGGGVLELMPNETERILLPYKKKHRKLLLTIDELLKEGTDIQDVLKLTNKVILKEGFGFSSKQIDLAHGIWEKLSGRRLRRGKS